MSTNRVEDLQLNTDTKSVNGSVILGKLTGPCADIINPTRNERKYPESLWEKVFKDPIVKEHFECGGIFGELGHPADRSETDMEKIAICMPEPPKKNDKGQLIGSWDILDTPNGRIAYALAKYGYKLGISSRGTGDVYTDTNGDEVVDEDTYDFQAFDLVLLPAVKTARLTMAESFNKDKKSFNKAINEALDNANADDRKIMTETLTKLNIDYSQSKAVNNRLEEVESTTATDNIGVSEEMAKQLQEALNRNRALEKQVQALQEKLSVGITKENRKDAQLEQYKRSISNLTEQLKRASANERKLKSLKENYSESIKSTHAKENRLKARLTNSTNKVSSLNESISLKDKQIKDLLSQVEEYRLMLEEINERESSKIAQLQESLDTSKSDSANVERELKAKLEKSSRLVEKYKTVAQSAVNKYIHSKAIQLGVEDNEIISQLPLDYSFDDIEMVCESVRTYKVGISNLPIGIGSMTDTLKNKKIKMNITESKEPLTTNRLIDDDVDEQLLNLANI